MVKYLGLLPMTWKVIAFNAVCVALNGFFLTFSLAPAYTGGLIGFHVGLIFSVVMIDRVFFDD